MPDPVHLQDLYGTEGSVSQPVAENGTGARPLTARATPEAFGAGVGEAITGAAHQALDTIGKYQGMLNETLATNADAALAEQIGAIKGKFKSMSGLEAVSAQQDTIAQMNQAFQKVRSTLPPMAAQGFDSMAKRSLGYSLGEVNEYGASQIKAANVLSHGQTAMMAALSGKDPSVAASDEQSDNKLGDITFAAASTLDPDHPGFTRDQGGNVTGFKDDANGQALQSMHENIKDTYTGEFWKNRIDTLASTNPVAAQQKFDENKDRIPPVAAADITATLEPQVTFAKGNQVAQTGVVQAKQTYQQVLTNPKSNGPYPYNLGNVKTKEGSANNTQDFLNPATPVDGVIMTVNTLRNGYDGMSLSQIGPKWTGEPDKAQVWIANAAAASGLDPNAKLNLNDPATLNSLLKGVAASEKSQKDRAAFTDDVISQGVQKALSGSQAQSSPQKSYATNPDGSKFTDADYLVTHKEQLLESVAANAERLYPGDSAVAGKARELMNQHIENVNQTQAANYRKDNMDVMRAITGDANNGKIPASENELRQLPGMADLLKRVPAQDLRFYESIPTLIAKAQRSDDKVNSPNGYSNIIRTLQPEGNPNGIYSQDHLDKQLGRSDGTGINYKDYIDAKKALGFSTGWKQSMLENMQAVERSGGNIDGKGAQRAMQFYNLANQVKDADPDADKKEIDFIAKNKDMSAMFMQSRRAQLANAASQSAPVQPTQAQTQNDKIMVVDSSGKKFMLPSGQLDEAIKAGYKRAE